MPGLEFSNEYGPPDLNWKKDIREKYHEKQRDETRMKKDWERADSTRRSIEEKGIIIEVTPGGIEVEETVKMKSVD